MTRIVYVNGAYKAYSEAAIHVEDRGFQFADAVYEVIEVFGGRLVDATRHLARLQHSLAELAIARPMSERALLHIIGEVVRRNRVRNGIAYIQVTRGATPRDFVLPGPDVLPTVVVLARSVPPGRSDQLAKTGIAVKTVSDPRWNRCDIKTVMLLPAVLAKDAARRGGAREVWFLAADGTVTEGGSSNAWIVTRKGVLVTHPLNQELLPGITRATVIDVAKAEGFPIEERAFTRQEAWQAKEAFVTSATSVAIPVIELDGQKIGDGRPGPVARRLRARFHQVAEISAG
jgi:D-alanine transaminase